MKKKNLLTLICIFLIPTMLLFTACSGAENKTTKTDFPLDEKGYPKNDVVLINDKSYPIEIAKVQKEILKLLLNWKKKAMSLILLFHSTCP